MSQQEIDQLSDQQYAMYCEDLRWCIEQENPKPEE